METVANGISGAASLARQRGGTGSVGESVVSRDLKKHFRENFPVFLDGALAPGSARGFFLRQARQSLSRRGGDPRIMSSAILREALESFVAKAAPSTKAGLVPVGPKRARVWWDPDAIGNLDDIIAGLTKPRPVIRFFDVTGLDFKAGRWNSVFDIDIDIGEKGRTIDFWSADRSYIVELGFIHADGLFLGLAKTNLIALPREGRGAAAGDAVSRTAISTGASRSHPGMVPDQIAREWVETRPDHSRRDLEAELLIHMIYKVFLASGPKAFRTAPHISRRASAILRQEFAQRDRRRERRLQTVRSPETHVVVVADLETDAPRRNAGIQHPPAVRRAAPFQLRLPAVSGSEFNRFAVVIAASRMFRPYQPAAANLVRTLPPRMDLSLSSASPVFEAAERLRRQLSRLSSEPSLPGGGKSAHARRRRAAAGDADRRFADLGMRITRMALTLEGRTRPGSRLTVAGKLVEIDGGGGQPERALAEGRSGIPPARRFPFG